MRGKLSGCQFLVSDVMTHPARERREALVGVNALLFRGVTKRHHKSDRNAGCVRTDHLQRRLEIEFGCLSFKAR